MVQRISIVLLILLCSDGIVSCLGTCMAEPPPPRVEQPECVVISDQSSDIAVPHSSTKKRSLVWSYFKESVVEKEAICNECEEKVSTSGNTTNMVKVSDVLFVQRLFVWVADSYTLPCMAWLLCGGISI